MPKTTYIYIYIYIYIYAEFALNGNVLNCFRKTRSQFKIVSVRTFNGNCTFYPHLSWD